MEFFDHLSLNSYVNQNDKSHKMEAQESDDKTNIDKCRIAANITEYHIISKLIFLRIIIPQFMNFLVTLIELLRFLQVQSTLIIRKHHTEFKIDRTIITCLNK